jgi:tellurite resistance protein
MAKPNARADIRIGASVTHVREVFFDVDYAIRMQPFHGVSLRWAGKRIQQETQILDRNMIEEFVIEKGPGGTWIKRFVEGHNAGGHFEATFEQLETASKDPRRDPEVGTCVQMVAFAPPQGFSLGLGKLSTTGLEKLLRRWLMEMRCLAMGYPPSSSRKRLHGVMDSLSALTAPLDALTNQKRSALVATLLEAAALVAVADGHADELEREVLDEVAASLARRALPRDAQERMVFAAAKSLKADAFPGKCDEIGQRCKRLGVAELGLSIAVLVAEASHGVAASELAALQRIAKAAELPDAALSSILSTIDELLGGNS